MLKFRNPPPHAPSPPMGLQRGVTLVELVISITILLIIVTTVFGALAVMGGHSGDPVPREQAISIAQSYLAEIRLKRYAAIGACPAVPPPGGRARFSFTCHYNGLVDNGARDQFGTAITALASYQISVSIFQVTDLPGIPAVDAQRIEVQVTTPANETVTLSGYRTREWN